MNIFKHVVVILLINHFVAVTSSESCNHATNQSDDLTESHTVHAQVLSINTDDDNSFNVKAAYYNLDYGETQPDTVLTIGPFKNSHRCKELIKMGLVYLFNLTAIDGNHKFQSNEEPELVHTTVKGAAGHNILKEGVAGSQMKLKCLGKNARQVGKVVWYKDGVKVGIRLRKSEHIKVNKRGSVLTLKKLGASNEGLYICLMKGERDLWTKKFSMRVLQCSASENVCDPSFCYNQGICCEKEHSLRCICFSTMRGQRCMHKKEKRLS